MKITLKQEHFLLNKKAVQVGHLRQFPISGFYVYDEAMNKEYMPINIFGKNLIEQTFHVKFVNDDIAFGNFYHRPKGPDFGIKKCDLEARGPMEYLVLLVMWYLPFRLYNFFSGKRNP